MKSTSNKKSLLFLFCTYCFCFTLLAQPIGSFTSVAPGTQQQTLVLPATHTFQRIIKTGDALSLGGSLGNNLDFTGYVPTAGSSTTGRLSISTENTPAEVAILDISLNATTGLWNVGVGGKVPFNVPDIGTVARFCSGTITPNNTVIVSEEDVTAGDANGDGYTDRGWLIEIDPVTRTVINQAGDNAIADKLWAIGRSNHENAVINANNRVLYTGADDGSFGYLYKFIPTVAGVFSSGNLYVLETTALLGNGTWKAVANTTKTDRNNCRSLSQLQGAYNFNGIEDVEIAPNGKIYFTAKAEGKIYRFTDNGTTGTTTDISGLEVFAGNSAYPTIVNYDVDGAGPLGTEAWGTGNDNLAFDGDGNLWVLQDGGRNHIWVIAPTHTQAAPQVKLFAKTPAGSEPTGITFTPNFRYLFLSFQHPNANTTAQTDAAGASVIFDTHTTVVIARTEHLGPFNILPVKFISFDAKINAAAVAIDWQVKNVNNHSYFAVERSTDGIRFEEIYRHKELIMNSTPSFHYSDQSFPSPAILFYRIKQCDVDGRCLYSKTVSVNTYTKTAAMLLHPVPAKNKINLRYYSENSGQIIISVVDATGRVVLKQKQFIARGDVNIPVNIEGLANGNFTLVVDDGEGILKRRFLKL